MWTFAHTIAKNPNFYINKLPVTPRVAQKDQPKLSQTTQPKLCKSITSDNLLGGGLFPFLTDDVRIKEYFHLKDLEDETNENYVLHHIPETEEMLYFLYDVEYNFRKAQGDQVFFRNQLIKNKLYKLFNILIGTKIHSPYPSINKPDDKWDLLAYQLISAWYIHAKCVCESPGKNKILEVIQEEKKYRHLW